MIILGIDPGTRTTGYGLIRKNADRTEHIDNGLILPDSKAPFPAKLREIFDKITSLIAEYKPQEMALEDVFVAKNVKSTLKLGHARGVVMLAATRAALPVFEYSPAEVKRAVSGFGRAGKEQIQKMVLFHLKLKETAAEDASDALAVALCHSQTHRWNK